MPTATATVSLPYKLIGGGAKVTWSGWGNMLFESYPSGQSWIATSKDHINSSTAYITTYAIGLQEQIPGFGYIDVLTNEIDSDCCSGTLTASNNTPFVQGYAAAGVGGRDEYDSGGWGRLLMSLYPSSSLWETAKSKDHKKACNGTLRVYAGYIRKRP